MKKTSAEEVVLEIKDKSELMVDLAYSSLLYNNKTIAEEVYDLENLIDDLYENLQRDTLEAVSKQQLTSDSALTIIKLAKAGEEIADAAMEIVDVQLRDVELHPIIRMSLKESDEVLSRVFVKKNSILSGKTLGELKLGSEIGMTIIAMRHKNRWLYGPNKKTLVESEDILFAKGPADAEKHLQDLADGKTMEI
ncbi:MAG: PhoU family transcriptional regulator [Candidatus Thermoplasmatota archaeon]|nr:PhoU family transcriptional regulator [Candidatus Thermoplasmatota archaeon]MBS3802162.1 PhoU family transcriptional regulator [Candidatus Thermoplasmatota archaeon]